MVILRKNTFYILTGGSRVTVSDILTEYCPRYDCWFVVWCCDAAQPFIEIRDGRHPCLSRTVSNGDFIPNDIVIGVADVSYSECFSSLFSVKQCR